MLYSDHVTIQTILALTSKGYVAVFLEHNDGSGSSCMLPDGSITEYVSPPNTKDFTAPENREFRCVEIVSVQKKISTIGAGGGGAGGNEGV